MLEHPFFNKIYKLTLNIRRNHAIEHATVSILTEQISKSAVIGFAVPSGFIIYSKSSKDEILSAANNGLNLMKTGDSEISISQFCGTNLVVAALLTGVSTVLLSKILGKKSKNILNITNGFLLSALLSKPIGRIVQKYVTTDPNVKHIQIKNSRSLRVGTSYLHFISTAYDELDSD
tara:strand:- start:207 stop:734 length:528 start_codon:yes stop_codon:yes gene_type:complete